MKKSLHPIAVLIPAVYFLLANCINASDFKSIIVPASSKEKQIQFGIDEIKRASVERDISVFSDKLNKQNSTPVITINIFSDSLKILNIVRNTGLTPPKHYGAELLNKDQKK
jgi:hypothetical protein